MAQTVAALFKTFLSSVTDMSNYSDEVNLFMAEVGLFLRNLKFFTNTENVHINLQLADLLRDVIVGAEILLKKVRVVDTQAQNCKLHVNTSEFM